MPSCGWSRPTSVGSSPTPGRLPVRRSRRTRVRPAPSNAAGGSMSSRSSHAATGIFALAAVCSGCAEVVAVDGNRYVDRLEKRFEVTGRPELTLSTFDGSVEVRPWDRSEVLIVVERRAGTRDGVDSIDIDVDQDGDRI